MGGRMKYMGSKARYAKSILPIILASRQPDQWYVEPFVGGANVIDKVSGPRIGAAHRGRASGPTSTRI